MKLPDNWIELALLILVAATCVGVWGIFNKLPPVGTW
jgi:hypothetical protein